ncbi:hypothetical protein A3K70_04515 [Candidatus Bathyarchaeota archaeon RBG_16_48_13]|nr:MAG: hypothetical protein A3K70_04515 [Candidatus Bathyarchaeota archaeon RBG_16_48_13]
MCFLRGSPKASAGPKWKGVNGTVHRLLIDMTRKEMNFGYRRPLPAGIPPLLRFFIRVLGTEFSRGKNSRNSVQILLK